MVIMGHDTFYNDFYICLTLMTHTQPLSKAPAPPTAPPVLLKGQPTALGCVCMFTNGWLECTEVCFLFLHFFKPPVSLPSGHQGLCDVILVDRPSLGQ